MHYFTVKFRETRRKNHLDPFPKQQLFWKRCISCLPEYCPDLSSFCLQSLFYLNFLRPVQYSTNPSPTSAQHRKCRKRRKNYESCSTQVISKVKFEFQFCLSCLSFQESLSYKGGYSPVGPVFPPCLTSLWYFPPEQGPTGRGF